MVYVEHTTPIGGIGTMGNPNSIDRTPMASVLTTDRAKVRSHGGTSDQNHLGRLPMGLGWRTGGSGTCVPWRLSRLDSAYLLE